MRVFVAGATGAIGMDFLRLARSSGCHLCALSRSPEKARQLEGLADHIEVGDACKGIPNLTGIDVVVSALGAPVTMDSPERRRYREVDFLGNQRLLETAQAVGVPRFVYVSAHVEPAYRQAAYIQAHESFVEVLRCSGINHSVIRPTGVFSALKDFVQFAAKGVAPVVGDGRARTNPIHPADVAAQILGNLESGPEDVSAGGPEIFTRREIVELAFRVLAKRPRVISVPAGVFRAAAWVAGRTNPRLGELLEFATAVSRADCIATPRGQLRLEDYFRRIAA